MNYMINGYEQAIQEHFDILDNHTRKTLLALDEDDQSTVLTNLTSKLYDDIVKKVDDIDYGTIADSKGDFTKIENYDELVECCSTIRSLLIQYKQDTSSIDTIVTAMDNLLKRKDLFEKSFRIGAELPMVMYCNIGLAIVSSISFMIATCIEFIKTPNDEPINLAIDRVALSKTKENLLFTNLARFNRICANGEFDKAMEYVNQVNTRRLVGFDDLAAGFGIAAIVCIAFNIIPILRELIFFFYYARTQIADYFEIQAELLKVNSNNFSEVSRKSKEETKAIKDKQNKVADFFKKIANFVAIDMKSTTYKVEKEKNETKKKYKVDEVLDKAPDSLRGASNTNTSSLF